MMKIFTICLACIFALLICSSHCVMGETKAAMLFLSSKDQPDTLGYNIVSQLHLLMYNEIIEGKVALWDSPDKNVKILPSTLKQLEENSKLSFILSEQLFIFEKWSIDKKIFSFRISGFFFSNRSPDGEEVTYGFVDYNDVELLLTSSIISANANGNNYTTYKFILLNHLYFHNIVQLGNRKINSVEESIKLKEEYAPFIVTNNVRPADSKRISYLIERPDASTSLEVGVNTFELLKSIEDFLNSNNEVYLNYGGDSLSDFMNVGHVKVESLSVSEIWIKSDTSIESQLVDFTVNLNSGKLQTLSMEDLWKLNLKANEITLLDALKQKEFYFRILRINSESISEPESQKYIKALKKASWNRVKEYVKYD